MKRSIRSSRISIVILILTLSLCPGPDSQAGALPALQLKPNQDQYDLTPYAEILEDKARQWTIDDVTAARLAKSFSPIRSKTLNLGMSTSAFWIRFTVRPESGPGDSVSGPDWLLDIDISLPLFTQFYIPTSAERQATGAGEWIIKEGGTPIDTAVTTSRRKLPYFRLPSDVNQRVTCYLRVEGVGGIILPLKIYKKEVFFNRSLLINTWCGINYGILLAMAVFNLFLFLSLHSRRYLWYVVFLVFTGFWIYGFNDITFFGYFDTHDIERQGRLANFLGVIGQ